MLSVKVQCGLTEDANFYNICLVENLKRAEVRFQARAAESLWTFRSFLYHSAYLADRLLVQNKVRMKFKGELVREDSPYRVVFCKVRKGDAEKFEEAIGKLMDKMLLLGHRDYPEICRGIGKMIEEGMKVKRGN